jgi:hypothetical protein
MRLVSAIALSVVALVAAACGSDPGPGKPYGVKTVERSFHRHHLNLPPFLHGDDPKLPENLSKRALDGDVLVGAA